jgi:hypothetical protein
MRPAAADSATAFHWIDPDVRVVKAADALRPGGVLATVTTHHIAGGSSAGRRLGEHRAGTGSDRHVQATRYEPQSAPHPDHRLDPRARTGHQLGAIGGRDPRRPGFTPALG